MNLSKDTFKNITKKSIKIIFIIFCAYIIFSIIAIATMKNHAGEPVVLQRGEAILGNNGNVIVHGKALEKETGTLRNYGLNKGIYRHNISRADAQQIPKIIKQNPIEISPRGQYIYNAPSKNGNFQVVTSPTDKGTIVSSSYYLKK